MSDPYAPPSNPTQASQFELDNRRRTRRTASLIIAVASFALCLSVAWLIDFEPDLVIHIICFWLCVFMLMALLTMRWGLPGFAIALLLSPITGFLSLLLGFVIELMLGFDLLPTPN
jgi:uncharacterized membrane protein YjjP (DUF1212 family)